MQQSMAGSRPFEVTHQMAVGAASLRRLSPKHCPIARCGAARLRIGTLCLAGIAAAPATAPCWRVERPWSAGALSRPSARGRRQTLAGLADLRPPRLRAACRAPDPGTARLACASALTYLAGVAAMPAESRDSPRHQRSVRDAFVGARQGLAEASLP